MPLCLRRRILLAAASGFLAGALTTASAQQAPCPSNGEPGEAAKSVIEKARAEIRQFREADGKPEDPNHPAVRWSEILWRCREQWAGTPAAVEATAEAVHILIHAARANRVMELADTVPADDPAWKQLLQLVFEAADEAKDFRGCLQRVERLLPHWREGELRAHGLMTMAQAHRRLGEEEQAALRFEEIQRVAAGTPIADRAAGALRQLRELNPGQLAPDFARRARDGSTVTLAGFRDRAVVLIFWSTT